MLKNVKKTLAIASVMAFALSLAPSALAAGPAKESRGNSGNVQTLQAQSKAQGRQFREENGVRNQLQQSNQGMQCEREVGPRCGMDQECISTAIAGLSEEDAETLSTYIDAYKDAVAAMQAALASAEEGTDLSDYFEAVQTARQDLLDAAEEENIELEPAKCDQSGVKNGKGHGLNPGSIASAIAKLSKEDTEALSTYFEAYQAAVAAAQAALASAEEGTDLSDTREAVQTALQDLLDAAEENGIDLNLVIFGQGNWMNGKGRGLNPGAVASSIAKLSKEDTQQLSTYIDAYMDAVAAMQAALASAEEGADLSDYREAVRTALQDLLDAASDAGVGLIPGPVLK